MKVLLLGFGDSHQTLLGAIQQGSVTVLDQQTVDPCSVEQLLNRYEWVVIDNRYQKQKIEINDSIASNIIEFHRSTNKS